MANKEDLRFIKTEKLIEETYLFLKKKNSASIKVSELCQEALINKSTFYSHYETIEALDDYICKKKINEILNNCPYIDCMISDTPNFVKSFIQSFNDNLETVNTLFASRTDYLLNILENYLLKRYNSMDGYRDSEMKVIFAIGGAARLLIESRDTVKISLLIELIEKIFN